MDEPKSARCDQFLINWYGVLWSNIDRSMRGIWNVLGMVTLTGTVLVAVHRGYLPYSVGVIVGFLLILWGVNITIDLNAWHRRNLFFLTAIERELLHERDYGRLLPETYKRPKPDWITFYELNMGLFVLLGLAFCGYALVRETAWPRPGEVWTIWVVPIHWLGLAIGIVLTLFNFTKQGKSARKHWEELFLPADKNEVAPRP